MAEDAAGRLQALVAAGEEIPYDVREPGEAGALPQYVPLTHRFIREHVDALRGLDSFGAACAALEASGAASPYLERLGLRPPAEPARQAELACVAFLCRLWADSTDFSLGEGRLAAAVEELERGTDAGEDEIEVVVPLRGLQMPVRRLELATATIVQADTVDVPAEARRPEGAGVAGWEPAFLAVTRVSGIAAGEDGAPDAGARAVEAFRQLITALRLFKAGGVGLGAYAWARSGADRWRRIATGAARPRAGGYRLAEAELDDLIAFSLALAERSSPFGAPPGRRAGLAAVLRRAISRFEAGLERNAVLEALNDYLLAARFLLEGGGPAGLSLSMRIAALCAEPAEREETKAIVDRALALERELWAGEPAGGAGPTAADTALAVEELVRAILKDAACGHLGSDLRATADEILLADGLAVGEGSGAQRGATAEWAPDDDPVPGKQDSLAAGAAVDELIESFDALGDDRADLDWGDPDEAPLDAGGGDRAAALQVLEPEGRISVERKADPSHEEENVSAQPAPLHEQPTELMPALEERRRRGASRARELLADRPAERQRTAARVAYLFPRPETTEWSVREIAYDRTRRARIRGT